MNSPANALDVAGALNCSRQRYLFRGIRRQHQTLKNLAMLDMKERRIASLREHLDKAEQELFNLRHALREEEESIVWPTWKNCEQTWHKPFVQRRMSNASNEYTLVSPAVSPAKTSPCKASPRRQRASSSPVKSTWTPRASPLKQSIDPFATPESVPPIAPVSAISEPAIRDTRDPPPKLRLPAAVAAAVLVETPSPPTAVKQKRYSLLFDSKQRLKRVLRLKGSSPAV